jgi:sugar/nucleoside kinase (ribokinase family)
MVRVVSLGVHIVDVLGRPVTEIPPRQDLALLDEIRMTVAGTAVGTAIDLAKLEMDVSAIGAIGEDSLGDFLTATMVSYGIHTEGLVRKRGVQTSATMLPIRPNGERPALHALGANAELTAADIDLELIRDARYLHVGGTPLLRKLDGKPLRGILEYAKNHSVTTSYDLLAMPDPSLQAVLAGCLPFVDYFMPGLESEGVRSSRERVRRPRDSGTRVRRRHRGSAEHHRIHEDRNCTGIAESGDSRASARSCFSQLCRSFSKWVSSCDHVSSDG